MSSAAKAKGIATVRKALGAKPPKKEMDGATWQEIVFARMGIKPGERKCCSGKMVLLEVIPIKYRIRQRAPPTRKQFLEGIAPNTAHF